MSYTNYNNTNSQPVQTGDVWANQQRVQLVRFSKVRNDNDGKPTRGALIRNEQGDERWVSESSHNNVFREIGWGQWCYYYGHGARPSLGTIPIETRTPDAREVINQSKADYWARIAEQNKQAIEPPEPIQFNQPSQVASNEVADDQLITEIAGTLGKFVMLTTEFNPMLSEESIVKLAISGYIQYVKQKSEMPLY